MPLEVVNVAEEAARLTESFSPRLALGDGAVIMLLERQVPRVVGDEGSSLWYAVWPGGN